MLISFFLTTICLLSGKFGWVLQFTLIGLHFFLLPTLLKQYTSRKKIIIVCLPFILIFGVLVVYNYILFNNIHLIPILFISLFSLTLGLGIKNKIFYRTLISIIIIATGIYIYPNWLNYSFGYNEIERFRTFPDVSLVSEKKTSFKFSKGKLKVIDVWSSSCANCIKEFPEFEYLKKEYEVNKNLEFYSLNLPIKGDSLPRLIEQVSKYSFKSIFAEELESWGNLEITSVPKILIVDKDNRIVYRGYLNKKWYHFYNNIHSLIESNF